MQKLVKYWTFVLKPQTTRWLKFGISLSLAASAGIIWWITEQQQSTFGRTYGAGLQKIHPELSIETIDFSGDSSFIIFELTSDTISDRNKREYLAKLTADIRDVYCSQLASSQFNPEIELFHVNIREMSAQGASILLSHSLTNNSCTDTNSQS